MSAVDIEFVRRVELGLPLLSDLARADVLLYCRGPQPNTAVVVAQARPHPVSPVFLESLVGRQVGKKTEPAIVQVLQRGRPTRTFNEQDQRGAPTVQEVYPLRSPSGSVIGVVDIEANILEYQRMRKKSPVFQKALERIRQMTMAGALTAAETLTPLGEHDGLMVVNQKGFVQYISGIAENLYRKLGHTGSLLSIHVSDLESDESIIDVALAESACIEREVKEHQLVWLKKAIPIVSVDASWFPGRAQTRRDLPSEVLVVIHDVTEERQREQALTVKTAMIKEIHHRVKNNLQTISALLRMQARRSSNPEVKALLEDSVNRILSVSVVHEFLSHDEDSFINIRKVCARIVSEVTQGILDPEKRIRILLEGENAFLPAQQATSTALVVNELLQNAIKHAYIGRNDGTVVVRLRQEAEALTIEIADDGIGLSPAESRDEGDHLGLQIVKTLVQEDLRGEFSLTADGGTVARVVLPRNSSKNRAVDSSVPV